jgi:hypothetical protein
VAAVHQFTSSPVHQLTVDQLSKGTPMISTGTIHAGQPVEPETGAVAADLCDDDPSAGGAGRTPGLTTRGRRTRRESG